IIRAPITPRTNCKLLPLNLFQHEHRRFDSPVVRAQGPILLFQPLGYERQSGIADQVPCYRVFAQPSRLDLPTRRRKPWTNRRKDSAPVLSVRSVSWEPAERLSFMLHT